MKTMAKLLHYGEGESKKATDTIICCAGAYFSKVDVTTPCLAYPAHSALGQMLCFHSEEIPGEFWCPKISVSIEMAEWMELTFCHFNDQRNLVEAWTNDPEIINKKVGTSFLLIIKTGCRWGEGLRQFSTEQLSAAEGKWWSSW